MIHGYNTLMPSTKFVYWEDQGMWVEYLEEYPDYRTQGQTFESLQEHLRDLYKDLKNGTVPGVRRLAELQFS